MSMPAQVRQQSEKVQELYRQLEEGAPDPKVVTAAVTPAPTDGPGAAPVVPDPVDTQPQTENFEQKYRTLQGMFNAEVPRLTAENRQLKERMANLETLLSTAPPQPKPATHVEPNKQKLITDNDVAEYGDAIEVMRRAAREEMAGQFQERIAQLENTIRAIGGKLDTDVMPRVQDVVKHQADTAVGQFWASLSAAIPDWQTVNSNPDFQSWLLERDSLSGFTRQTFLDDAQQKLDANRVVAIFKEWPGRIKPVEQHQTSSDKQRELEAQLAPGKSRGAGTGQPKKDTVYSRDDIRKFYADVASGKFKGNDTERARIEADIFAAQRDNRIT